MRTVNAIPEIIPGKKQQGSRAWKPGTDRHQARKNKVVAVLILISFALSFAMTKLPLVSTLSGGTRTIILTVLIAGLAALLFPVPQQDEEDKIS